METGLMCFAGRSTQGVKSFHFLPLTATRFLETYIKHTSSNLVVSPWKKKKVNFVFEGQCKLKYETAHFSENVEEVVKCETTSYP
jgi:hypothetical protein